MATRLKLFYAWLGLVGVLAVSQAAMAQTQCPWFWWPILPTIPTYPKCLKGNHPPVVLDYEKFQIGCCDISTGLPVTCWQDWHEYFSLDCAFTPWDIYNWEGGHAHPRPSDVKTATGGIYSLLSPGPLDLSRIANETGQQLWTAYKYHPEASGVDRITAKATCHYPYVMFPDDTWHRDASDPSGRTVVCEIAFFVGIGGLIQLPLGEGDCYVEDRGNVGHHLYGDYVHPWMAPQLAALACAYREIYAQAGSHWVKLSYNDASLPWGGVFDLDDDLDCPHVRHRLGMSIDVNHDCPTDDGGTVKIDIGILRRALKRINNVLKINETELAEPPNYNIHLDW